MRVGEASTTVVGDAVALVVGVVLGLVVGVAGGTFRKRLRPLTSVPTHIASPSGSRAVTSTSSRPELPGP